jgi:hypothetical protein
MSEQVGVYLSNNIGQIFVLHLLHTPYRKWTVPSIERLSTDSIEECALRALWKHGIYEINLHDLVYLGINRRRNSRSILHGFLVRDVQFDWEKVCFNGIDLCQWSPFDRTADLIPSWQRGHLKSIALMK